MDELVNIKTLEAKLAAELEKSRREASSSVDAAKAGRSEAVGKAVRDAESQAGRMVSESAARAQAEAEAVRARCEADLKALAERHSKNRHKAVDFVLKELGV